MQTLQGPKRAIVERAFKNATRLGLEGVTIGGLAADLGLSKAGVHSHFGTKEGLQEQIVAFAIDEFTRIVIQPTLSAETGLPRLKALFSHWVGWYERYGKLDGCFFVSNATEMDDRPGAVRDALVGAVQNMLRLICELVRECVSKNEFIAETDPQQFAFEMYGVILAHHNADRFLQDAKAGTKAQRAFNGLLTRYTRQSRSKARPRA